MKKKSELIKILSLKFERIIPHHEIAAFTNETFNFISKSLADGERVEIRGFGSFKVIDRRARHAMNPKTMEKLIACARKKIAFHVTKETKEKLEGFSKWQ